LGGAIKSFKSSMKDDGSKAAEAENAEPAQLKQAEENVVEGEKVEEKEKA
jgi:Sec-independent protein translocase protein TatA